MPHPGNALAKSVTLYLIGAAIIALGPICVASIAIRFPASESAPTVFYACAFLGLFTPLVAAGHLLIGSIRQSRFLLDWCWTTFDGSFGPWTTKGRVALVVLALWLAEALTVAAGGFAITLTMPPYPGGWP